MIIQYLRVYTFQGWMIFEIVFVKKLWSPSCENDLDQLNLDLIRVHVLSKATYRSSFLLLWICRFFANPFGIQFSEPMQSYRWTDRRRLVTRIRSRSPGTVARFSKIYRLKKIFPFERKPEPNLKRSQFFTSILKSPSLRMALESCVSYDWPKRNTIFYA